MKLFRISYCRHFVKEIGRSKPGGTFNYAVDIDYES